LDALLKRDPKNVKAAVFQARVFRTQGNTPEALESLSDALELQPDDESLRITYARLLVDAKRYEDAREQFERLVRDAPDNVDVRHALGLLLMQTNHMAEARGQFEKLVKMGQRRDTSYYYLGQIAESENETDKAIAAYRHVDRGEQYLNAQIRIALLLAESGDLAAARGHLHALPQGSPADSVRVYRAEAEVLARVERHKDAMKVYDMALEEHPGNGDLLYARAMLATKLDRMDILERDLREILSRDPDNADALNALGYTLADRSQRYEDALVLIKRALQLKPDDFYVLDSMGWVMYRLQRYPEAIEYLRRAIALQNDPEIAAHLGEVLWVTGDHKGAQEVWEAALESTPDDERLLEVIKRFRP
jgi:tetratricopeptide (TPR) repeat protein